MINEWAVADMEGNIMTLRNVHDGSGPSGFNRRLEVTGEFRLGEIVNKIVPITSHPTHARESWAKLDHSDLDAIRRLPREGPLVTPRAFMATIEGSIYMLGTINPPFLHALLGLQSVLASRAQAPGFMPWSKYRAWKTEVMEKDEPFRVVDGEMLEAAIHQLSDAELEECLREVGLHAEADTVSVPEVRRWGEELRRLC
jgi:DNA damage-binding protein 1